MEFHAAFMATKVILTLLGLFCSHAIYRSNLSSPDTSDIQGGDLVQVFNLPSGQGRGLYSGVAYRFHMAQFYPAPIFWRKGTYSSIINDQTPTETFVVETKTNRSYGDDSLFMLVPTDKTDSFIILNFAKLDTMICRIELGDETPNGVVELVGFNPINLSSPPPHCLWIVQHNIDWDDMKNTEMFFTLRNKANVKQIVTFENTTDDEFRLILADEGDQVENAAQLRYDVIPPTNWNFTILSVQDRDPEFHRRNVLRFGKRKVLYAEVEFVNPGPDNYTKEVTIVHSMKDKYAHLYFYYKLSAFGNATFAHGFKWERNRQALSGTYDISGRTHIEIPLEDVIISQNVTCPPMSKCKAKSLLTVVDFAKMDFVADLEIAAEMRRIMIIEKNGIKRAVPVLSKMDGNFLEMRVPVSPGGVSKNFKKTNHSAFFITCGTMEGTFTLEDKWELEEDKIIRPDF